MLCDTVHCETYIFPSQTLSSASLYSLYFEGAKAVFTVRHVVEPGSSEAYRGRVIDYSHF